MAYYKSGIVSKNIDPIHHSKARSEFHLDPNTMYVSNMRLLNIGVTTVEDVPVMYNLIGGAPSVIKNIYLYDGRQVLDQLTNHAHWMAFVHYNKSNSESIELTNILHRTRMGYVFDKESGIRPDGDLLNPKLAQVKTMDTHVPNYVTLDEFTTSQCFLNLTDVFPLLNNMPTIDTQLFQNFRIVIEYNSNSDVCLSNVDAFLSKKISATQPLLVIDEITNPQACMTIRSQFKGVVWKAIEVESVLLPAPSGPEELSGSQKRSWKFTGLTGKTIFRMLVQKSCTDLGKSLSFAYKSIGSEAMERETWQVAVNNQNLFPNSGIISTNEKLQLLTQTWGTCNAITCGTGGYLVSRDYTTAPTANIIELPDLATGHTDYFGCMVSQAVKSLSLSYSRGVSAAQDGYYKTPLTFNVFAEVQKVITPVKGGGYSVSYL